MSLDQTQQAINRYFDVMGLGGDFAGVLWYRRHKKPRDVPFGRCSWCLHATAPVPKARRCVTTQFWGPTVATDECQSTLTSGHRRPAQQSSNGRRPVSVGRAEPFE